MFEVNGKKIWRRWRKGPVWVWGSDMGTYMDYMEKYMNL